MSVFKRIREFIWPLLEKDDCNKPVEAQESIMSTRQRYSPKAYEFAINYYNQEHVRLQTVESKASLFIGIFSVVISIVLGVTSFLVKEVQIDTDFLLLIIPLFLLIIYLSRTIWFSIKALERKNYYSLSIKDFLTNNEDEDLTKIIAEIDRITRFNAIVINVSSTKFLKI